MKTWLAVLCLCLVASPALRAEEPVPVALAIEGNNALALDLLKKQQKRSTRNDNVTLPAYNLASALSLVLQGAKGKTLEEIVKTLRLENTGKKDDELKATLALGYKTLAAQIGTQEKNNPFKSANGIFSDTPIPATFIQVAKESFSAGAETLNFTNDTDWKKINDFISDNTDKKIPGLLSRNPGPQTTVLVSASRFLGDWTNPFPEKSTSQEKFTTLREEEKNIPLMLHHEAKFLAYAEDDNAQYVKLTYKKGYSMLVALPRVAKGEKLSDSFDRAQEALTAQKYQELNRKAFKAAQPKDGVTLLLPKFDLKYTSNDLKTDLKETMPLAFSSDAEFAGLGGGSISDVLAEAHVRVDEKGTAAQGAAAIMLSRGISQAKYVRADHPFLYFIQKDEKEGGVILFAGVVQNPEWTDK